MARGAVRAIPGVRGIVIAPRAPGARSRSAAPERIGGVTILRGEHPIPGRGSLAATRRLVAALRRRPKGEPVLLLLSGGASALLAMPARGIPEADEVRLQRLLFRSGLPIAALNAVRKHVSAVKGGGLLRLSAPRMVWTLAMSDVVGDDPSTIGSGPAVADPTTFAQALALLLSAVARSEVPRSVLRHLERGAASPGRGETVKPGDPEVARSRAIVIGSNATALAAAARRARLLGYAVRRLPDPIEGEASTAARSFAEVLPRRPWRPLCVLAGGETVVAASGSRGRGGRNQEFALAAAEHLAGTGWTLLAAGTDGVDGPTPAAGAILDGSLLRRAGRTEVARALAAHDSFGFFARHGGGLVTGPTGTNVMDVVIALHEGRVPPVVGFARPAAPDRVPWPRSGARASAFRMARASDGSADRPAKASRSNRAAGPDQRALHRVTLIPGDGIGPEVVAAAVRVIAATGVEIEWDRQRAGREALLEDGTPIPESLVQSIRRNKVALKGPLETQIGAGFRSVNVALRKTFDLYANLRPIRSIPGVVSRYDHVDLVVVRENTESLYSGIEHQIAPGVVESVKVITARASTRIAEFAFRFAEEHGRRKVMSIHKANIMKLSDGLFLDCARRVARRHPRIAYDEMIVDNACMQLVLDPRQFDVLLLENLYGDIVSDLCAGLVGGLGVTPSANLGGRCAIFEAVHGTAPGIAGRNRANPLAVILSSVLLLERLGEEAAAGRLQAAVLEVTRNRRGRTGDLGGTASTEAVADAIIARLAGRRASPRPSASGKRPTRAPRAPRRRP